MAGARAKGTAVVQCVKALRAMPQRARQVLPARLHHYIDERILVSSWYPEADYLALITALTQILPAPRGVDVWEHLGVVSAQHDLTTVYRGLLRGGDLMATVRAARDLFRIYHEPVTIDIEVEGDRILLDVLEYTSMSAGHCRFITAYMKTHAKMTLDRPVQLTETLCRSRGDDRCRREFTSALVAT